MFINTFNFTGVPHAIIQLQLPYKISDFMAHNIPAVYNGFLARISKPLGLQGYKTVGEGWRWNRLSL
jgi:hypothetical protein